MALTNKNGEIFTTNKKGTVTGTFVLLKNCPRIENFVLWDKIFILQQKIFVLGQKFSESFVLPK